MPDHAEQVRIDAPVPAIDAALADVVDSMDAPDTLRDAIRYALLGGGKRIRPLLAWWSGVAAGGRGEATLPGGAAVELVHAFSLVHDDLPAMDDDDLRRGRPTLHIHAGEAMAILAGDAMLSMSFAALASAPDPGALVKELADGTGGMISGQVHDTLGGNSLPGDPWDRLQAIHHKKTGALIRASCRIGARLGLHDAAAAADHAGTIVDRLGRYGESIGLMFQVVDDLLDATGDHQKIGKRTRKDDPAGKLTAVGVLGVDGARAKVQELRADALEHLAPLGSAADPLRAMVLSLETRDR